MSRLAKKPILIPGDVTVTHEGNVWTFRGPKGEIRKSFSDIVRIEEKKLPEGENALVILLEKSTGLPRRGKIGKAMLGTTAAILRNAVIGVKNGFEKKLEIEGIGYKVQLDGNELILSLGYTHPVRIKTMPGVSFAVQKNVIVVSGVDKEKVGEAAAYIRMQRPPEVYKSKGIRYAGEIIRRKAGKKAVATT